MAYTMTFQPNLSGMCDICGDSLQGGIDSGPMSACCVRCARALGVVAADLDAGRQPQMPEEVENVTSRAPASRKRT